MSENEFISALLDLGNDLRDWQGAVEADLLTAEIATDFLSAWIEPKEAELRKHLEQCLEGLRGLADQLGLDADRVDRIAGRLERDLQQTDLPQQDLFAACLITALRDELQQTGAHLKDEPVGPPPLQTFHISLPPAEMEQLASRLLDSGDALLGWAQSIQLQVTQCLGVYFDTLYSRSFLPGVSLLRTAADLGYTLTQLGLWLNLLAQTYGHCERIEAQFEPRLARVAPTGALEFGLLVLSPEHVHHEELPLNYSVLADSQMSLPIQAEPEGA